MLVTLPIEINLIETKCCMLQQLFDNFSDTNHLRRDSNVHDDFGTTDLRRWGKWSAWEEKIISC